MSATQWMRYYGEIVIVALKIYMRREWLFSFFLSLAFYFIVSSSEVQFIYF